MSYRRRAACAFAFVLPAATATAQSPPPQPSGQPPLAITVTADRIPTALQRTGSAVTILRAEEIAKSSPSSLVDALRAVPGLDIAETGGPGSTATIRLRGANSGQTLVMIDGVRVNDASGASGEFDVAVIAPALIERIEVLRGPQSALYGSDAIGGVVNIITRKGGGTPRVSVGLEGGSYGTINATAAATGSAGAWSYSFAGLGQLSDGFSRFGYRIGRLGNVNNIAGLPGGSFEKDGFTRIGGFGRVGYDPGNGFRLDLGVVRVDTDQKYDAAFGAFPDTPAFARRVFTQGSLRAELDTFDGRLTHQVQLFLNRTERRFRDVSLARVGGTVRETSRTLTDFDAERYGAEYQATLRLMQFGSLIAGARFERETADGFGRTLVPAPTARRRTLAAEQDTASAFALWQWPVNERFNLSLGGRYDQVSDSGSFPTWRATASYRIPETGSRLRASVGTGAKAATLFQRFSPDFGTANLRAEKSFGFDAGIDQELLNGRVTLSATVFSNRIRDLIDFESGPRCRANQPFGCYVNIARATTAGVEVSARAVLIEGWLSASGVYTYLHAKDDKTNLTLARRAPHTGRIAFEITPTTQWTITPSIVFASARFSSANERQRLAPYARLDVHTEYRLNETWRAHARVENITDTRYQEVFNYGTTGRAIYAGLTATW
jgi:vitamin B12 transporter